LPNYAISTPWLGVIATGAIVEVEQLSRRFGTKQTLSEASYRVGLSIMYSLARVNGAGKTTLIKHLLTLL